MCVASMSVAMSVAMDVDSVKSQVSSSAICIASCYDCQVSQCVLSIAMSVKCCNECRVLIASSMRLLIDFFYTSG